MQSKASPKWATQALEADPLSPETAVQAADKATPEESHGGRCGNWDRFMIFADLRVSGLALR